MERITLSKENKSVHLFSTSDAPTLMFIGIRRYFFGRYGKEIDDHGL